MEITVLGAIGLLALTTAAGACSNGSADQVTTPVAVGMSSKVMPSYADGNITLYDVYAPVPLPVRRPTNAERQALGKAPSGTGYPHAPFLLASDESVEVHFVLSNLEDTDQDVWLLIDPWNEFVRWKPGVTVVSDEETLPNEGYDREFVVPAKSRVEGTMTTDDMQEVAIKLASAEHFLASPQATQNTMPGNNGPDPAQVCDNIFDWHNRSNSGDPFYTPWIPPVVAGLTGFDLGLRVEMGANSGANAAPSIAVEVTVDVQDMNGNRFVQQGSTNAEIGTPPKVLSPPAARF